MALEKPVVKIPMAPTIVRSAHMSSRGSSENRIQHTCRNTAWQLAIQPVVDLDRWRAFVAFRRSPLSIGFRRRGLPGDPIAERVGRDPDRAANSDDRNLAALDQLIQRAPANAKLVGGLPNP